MKPPNKFTKKINKKYLELSGRLFYLCTHMKNFTPYQQLVKRRNDAIKELKAVVEKNVPAGKSTNAYHTVGVKFGITAQTVYNYIEGKGKDGYLIDALIEEFKNYTPNA